MARIWCHLTTRAVLIEWQPILIRVVSVSTVRVGYAEMSLNLNAQRRNKVSIYTLVCRLYSKWCQTFGGRCIYAGHYCDVIMGAIASQITSLTIVYSTVYSDADQRRYQSSASLAFVRGIHRWPVNSPHKWSATRKMFPFDDVIMRLDHHSFRKWLVAYSAIWDIRRKHISNPNLVKSRLPLS